MRVHVFMCVCACVCARLVSVTGSGTGSSTPRWPPPAPGVTAIPSGHSHRCRILMEVPWGWATFPTTLLRFRPLHFLPTVCLRSGAPRGTARPPGLFNERSHPCGRSPPRLISLSCRQGRGPRSLTAAVLLRGDQLSEGPRPSVRVALLSTKTASVPLQVGRVLRGLLPAPPPP